MVRIRPSRQPGGARAGTPHPAWPGSGLSTTPPARWRRPRAPWASWAEDAAALGHALAEGGCTPDALRAYENVRLERVSVIAAAAIEQTGRYYREKDADANPFMLNGQDLFRFVMSFEQPPVPAGPRPEL